MAENRDNGDNDQAAAPPSSWSGEEEKESRFENLASLSTSGPLSNSARVAILAALLAIRRTTFTELMLAVNLPKSSLNLSIEILKENKLVTVRRGFLPVGGPRTFVEITPEGEKAIRDYLALLQSVARRLLPH